LILVLVGMHSVAFDRLVQAADRLATQLDENVIIQRGCSTYIPVFATSFDYITCKQIEKLTTEARVVVTHAGAGSIILTLRLGKSVVIVPRSRKLGKGLDDHQQQLAYALAKKYKVPVVSEVTAEGLLECIQRVEHQKVWIAGNSGLVQAMREQLAVWDQAKREEAIELVR